MAHNFLQYMGIGCVEPIDPVAFSPNALTKKNPALENNKKEKNDEYIWVEGYKATNADMTCLNQKYAVGKRVDLPEGVEPKTCTTGFHMCLYLTDVFKYYPIGDGHRYFKVRGLVRKEDVDKYGTFESYLNIFPKDKLAAKSIEFITELTVDEIFAHTEYKYESPDFKHTALLYDIETAVNKPKIQTLINLGYCEPFARYVVEKNKYDIAYAVGMQPDLSMDMKAMLIFK